MLWRLLASPDGLLVGEDRDTARKSVSFFCIDRGSGVIQWKDLRFDEPWWIGIEAIHRGVIFFHGYAAPDMPDHKMIVAVNCRSGAVLWTNREKKFLFAHEDHVYAVEDRYENRKFFAIGVHDGAPGPEVSAEQIGRLRGSGPDERTGVRLPEPVASGDKHEHVLASVRSLQLGLEPAVADAMYEAGDAIVVSCHARSGGTPEAPEYRQELAVVEKKSGKILYRDCVADRAASVVPDIFFSIGGMIYYVRDRKTLRAVNLLSGEKTHGKN